MKIFQKYADEQEKDGNFVWLDRKPKQNEDSNDDYEDEEEEEEDDDDDEESDRPDEKKQEPQTRKEIKLNDIDIDSPSISPVKVPEKSAAEKKQDHYDKIIKQDLNINLL